MWDSSSCISIKFQQADIYWEGGRKFALSSLSPLASVPSIRAIQAGYTGPSKKEVAALVKLHNRVLAKVLLKLKKELLGLKYSNLNFYTYLKERINHPSNYGFKEGKTACCGSGAYRGL
ncbi:unnamed protein product [Prunus armeniaca]|uniref:Uncharacterized protein n=1 Tax=Prunus armeniaca TaxID=36596 RepID=A0A6J5WU32_PRUAR|nr:unnamed protein product [Prunus armeniaca]